MIAARLINSFAGARLRSDNNSIAMSLAEVDLEGRLVENGVRSLPEAFHSSSTLGLQVCQFRSFRSVGSFEKEESGDEFYIPRSGVI